MDPEYDAFLSHDPDNNDNDNDYDNEDDAYPRPIHTLRDSSKRLSTARIGFYVTLSHILSVLLVVFCPSLRMITQSHSHHRSQNENAVIVYMCSNSTKDIENIQKSLFWMNTYFNKVYDYPVVIFHENLNPEQQNSIRQATLSSSSLTFALLNFTFTPEMERMNEQDPFPPMFDECKGRRSFSMGYRHMCRFFAFGIFEHPALLDYQYYMRVDTDSFIRSRITYDVFQYMNNNNIKYGYRTLSEESECASKGFFDAVKSYASEKNLDIASEALDPFVSSLDTFTSTTDGKEQQHVQWNHRMIYNNFEIVDMNFFRDDVYRDYFRYIDNLGGIYRHRWGDAPIRTFGTGLLLEKEEIHHFQDFCYFHQGTKLLLGWNSGLKSNMIAIPFTIAGTLYFISRELRRRKVKI